MRAVSNTSPKLNLAIINQLDLLPEQFGEIWVPPMVIKELRLEEELPGSHAIRGAREAGWLRVGEVKDQSIVQLLQRDLDRGEAEAIALALQLKAEWTLLDERDARKVAKALGLNVTGLLGILLRAQRQGKSLSLQKMVEELRDNAGFRIGAELVADLLRQSEDPNR
jgi:hypothetical protein